MSESDKPQQTFRQALYLALAKRASQRGQMLEATVGLAWAHPVSLEEILGLAEELHKEYTRDLKAAAAKLPKLEEQVADQELYFDLRWKADMRAIKRWQAAAPGRALIWPDHADLCTWLLEQLDAAKASGAKDETS